MDHQEDEQRKSTEPSLPSGHANTTPQEEAGGELMVISMVRRFEYSGTKSGNTVPHPARVVLDSCQRGNI
jgi:hypothetical protein